MCRWLNCSVVAWIVNVSVVNSTRHCIYSEITLSKLDFNSNFQFNPIFTAHELYAHMIRQYPVLVTGQNVYVKIRLTMIAWESKVK